MFTHWIDIPDRTAAERFTPWQIVLSTLTGVYAIRNFDKILGFNGKLTSSASNPLLKHSPQHRSRLPV